MRQASTIDRYLLYGEPPREAELRFMHIERIATRSGSHEWSIKPHTHSDLHQVLLLETGGGTMWAEAEMTRFEAPAILVIPAGTVHAFEFMPQTDGEALTVAETLAHDAGRGDPVLTGLLQVPGCFEISQADLAAHELPEAFQALAREFIWSAPARMPMIEAHLIRILVGVGRLALERRSTALPNSTGDALLIERFRQLIEKNFREKTSVRQYASMLGVTESRLLTACRSVHGEPAVKLIQQRRVVEAQRYLLYTMLSASEISFALGFQDPSYFSRFFVKCVGETPSAYRARRLLQ
jgi:AraC family transcriptional activator of pobA